MYGIYGNIYHQYTPNVSINLPYDWILWVMDHETENSRSEASVRRFRRAGGGGGCGSWGNAAER